MKKKMLIWLVALIPLGIISFSYANDKYFLIAKNLDIFTTMFKEVNAHYVDEVSPSALVTTGVDAMLRSLDPYNNFIPEDELEDFRTSTTGQYAGIGAVYSVINNKVRITRLHEGFSAQRAGLELGDELLSVDGVKVTPENIFEISKTLKGQINSEAKIEIKKITGEQKVISVVRERITVGSITYHGLINEQTGYIKLEEFTMGAGHEVKDAVIELKANGATKIILDLRGNGGGLLTEAVRISNVFIDKGKEIVSTIGQFKDLNQEYYAMNDATDVDIPLVVLINEESASASEVVCGVIQDYDRGILVGRKTFGKGLVQTTRSLSFNSQLNVTTAKYYIPSGRCIQAIDYSSDDNRTIHDSLRTEFQTSSGRKVFDGSGIEPDITIKAHFYSPIAITLAYKGLLFEYAVKFKADNQQDLSSRDFKLSDQQYQEFINWVNKRDYNYVTGVENTLDNLINTAKDELYYSDLQKEIDNLRERILENKASDLITFQEEISQLLEEEIAGTYNYYRGEIEASFATDTDISAALDVLSDPDKYNRLLGN